MLYEVITKMIASEQIPPMSLLIEKNVGGAEVLGVKSDEELKAYVQEVFNRTEDTSTDEQNSGNDSHSTTNGSNSTPKIKNEAADTSSGP